MVYEYVLGGVGTPDTESICLIGRDVEVLLEDWLAILAE